jgi:hypothetical protein
MFGWISRSALPEESTIDWLFEVYGWLLEETGGFAEFRERAQLILPTERFFPISKQQAPHAYATALFEATRAHAGMEEFQCKLEPHEEATTVRDLLGPDVPMESRSVRTAGTFRHGAGIERAVISYAPSKLEEPEAFVATMAHELGHFLMHSFGSSAPGGDDLQEHATDVCAIFLGFGVFAANSAFRFEQHQGVFTQGWSTSRLGYLGQRPLSYALAIFLALLALDLKATQNCLTPNPRDYAKNALRHLAKERAADLERLRNIGARKAAKAS